MDPYRASDEAAPPPEEPARDEEPEEEDPATANMRLFRRKWRTLSVLACVVAAALFSPLYFLALVWLLEVTGILVVSVLLAEALHAVIYLSPFWTWGVARDELRRESWGVGLGGWIVASPRSPWLVATIAASLPLSAAALLVAGFEGLVAVRVFLFVAWLFACLATVDQVGVLRWTRTEDGRRALELEGVHRRRLVELESVDVEAGRARFVIEGRSVSWRSISPLDRLARDVKPSPLGKM